MPNIPWEVSPSSLSTNSHKGLTKGFLRRSSIALAHTRKNIQVRPGLEGVSSRIWAFKVQN
jgi:hypothetical protein